MSKIAKQPKRVDAAAQNKAFSGFSARSLLNLILERWWIGLLVAAVFVTAFILAQPKREPQYEARVKLAFETKSKNILPIAQVRDTVTSSAPELNMHVAELNSETFYEYFANSLSPKDVELIVGRYRDPNNPNGAAPNLRNIVKSNLYLVPEKQTTIVQVVAQNRDPEAAALVANRYARKYIDYVLEHATGDVTGVQILLKNQSEEKRIEVEAADRAMQEYRAKHNMAALGENKNVTLQKVATLGNALVQLSLEQSTLKNLIDAIEDYSRNGKDLFEISAIAAHGSVANLKGELDAARAARIQLEEDLLEEHPQMKANALHIETTEQRFKNAVNLAVAEMKNRYATAQQNEVRLRKDLAEAEAQVLQLDKIADAYRFLESDANIRRAHFTTIQNRLNETNLVSQMENAGIRILDKAYIPGIPINATPSKIALQAGLIGLVLFLGVPVVLGLMDTRVKAPSDVEHGLEMVLLGGIKTMKKLSETERPNVFRLGKDDALSEAYRGIFSEIEIRSVVPFPKRMLITSSVPSEGKSLTASNLAAVFAAHGRKTLLVDCDFRRPTLRRYFGATAGVGLLPWLRENSHRPDSVVDPHKLGIMNIGPAFDLLPAGDAIKNPTEIIDQIASCDLFNKLSKIYDLVVIDTPPSAVFPDALLLSRFCSEMVYVCRFKTVRRALIKKTLAKFQESGITNLGVVLNCVPSSSIMNYGYDGYGAYNSEYYRSYQTEKAAS